MLSWKETPERRQGFCLERRHRRVVGAPTQGRTTVPQQLDRGDFPRPDAPWLVALFTSKHCDSCAGLLDKAKPLESPDVGLHVPPMVWATQYQYSPDTVLMVYASERYDPDDYLRDYNTFLRLVQRAP